jgi:hypothetical protein
MPLTIFDSKGILGNRRERIETAVEAGGRETAEPHEAWIRARSRLRDLFAATFFSSSGCRLIQPPYHG